MDQDTQNPVTRIAELENRLGAVETQASKEEKGWIARFGVASVIVGCLTGALGGVGAVIGLWHEFVVTPHVRLDFSGDNIEAHWNPEAHRLSFDCWFAANNDGSAADILRAARARLRTATGATLNFQEISVKGAGDSRASFPIKLGEPIEVQVTVTLRLDDLSEQRFREAGLHVLDLDFETSLSHTRQTMTYCFWFGEQAVGELVKNGSLATVRDQAHCGQS